jgi:hypothetical protein
LGIIGVIIDLSVLVLADPSFMFLPVPPVAALYDLFHCGMVISRPNEKLKLLATLFRLYISIFLIQNFV